ncbi:hypothetical protein FGE12_11995 [Aggregicoccus sp. 17bor-14]|uniref:bile acid:sodium symporter n=1 Tax=Myxococcaceae TaxID=31 RepID=UPI00129D00EC|nr:MULTISPECIES: bile acid:sodium symporter [Myxococcaceae]MBF5043110.1 bile acid:sodium symporter [Simulacricoccus sp. 17bor-14]MRI88872.1 hypothetical protein [Aggregicoccus sp. 17bor-14]
MLRSLIAFASENLVFAVMFFVGLQSRPEDLRDVGRRPALYLRALGVLLLAVPLLALALVSLARLPAETSLALLLLAVCPGVAHLTTTAQKEGGSLVTALNVLLLSSLLTPLTLGLWLASIGPAYGLALALPAREVFATTVPAVLGPLALGMLLHAALPGAVPVLTRFAQRIVSVALWLVILLALARSGAFLLHVSPRTLLAFLAFVSGAALLGHAAGGPRREDRIAVAIAAVYGNPALALAIAQAHFPDSRARSVVDLYVLLRLLAVRPYKRWARAGARSDVEQRLPPPRPLGGARRAHA